MSRHLEVTYCDDIRNEIGNKTSIIGVYSQEMLLNQIPTVLPKLWVRVVVTTPAKQPIETLQVKILMDDIVLMETGEVISDDMRKTAADAATKVNEVTGENTLSNYELYFQFAPFQIQKPGRIRVRGYTENEELKGRALTIKLAEQIQPPVQTKLQ